MKKQVVDIGNANIKVLKEEKKSGRRIQVVDTGNASVKTLKGEKLMKLMKDLPK